VAAGALGVGRFWCFPFGNLAVEGEALDILGHGIALRWYPATRLVGESDGGNLIEGNSKTSGLHLPPAGQVKLLLPDACGRGPDPYGRRDLVLRFKF
jgi:hypothetical protein